LEKKTLPATNEYSCAAMNLHHHHHAFQNLSVLIDDNKEMKLGEDVLKWKI